MFRELGPRAHHAQTKLPLSRAEHVFSARRERRAEHVLDLESVCRPDPRRPAVASATLRFGARHVLEPVKKERRALVPGCFCHTL